MKRGPGVEPNPWIDRRHFDTVQRRCIAAEELAKALIDLIVGDDGTWRAEQQDYQVAGERLLKGDV